MPETVATPFVNVIAVAVPKFTAVPDELVTVGLVPFGLAKHLRMSGCAIPCSWLRCSRTGQEP